MSLQRCRVCGHPLRDPVSVSTGVGPTCANRRSPAPEIMFEAAYFAEVVAGVLVIFDRDAGSLSVTNDVERVIEKEADRRGEKLPRLVIYRDSEGRYDQIRHRNGVYGGIAPIGAQSLDAAIHAVKQREQA